MTVRGLPTSLHARMLLLSMVATIVALVVAGWVIAGVLERFVTEGIDRRLDAEVSLLAGAVDGDGRVDRTLLGQRLGALEGGPGWRWRIVAPGGAIGSADFPRLDPGPPLSPRGADHKFGHDPHRFRDDRLHPIEGETEAGVRVHARQLAIRTRGGPVLLTAAAPRDVIRRPVEGALVPLLVTLGVLALLLGASTVLQLRLGLRPLRRLREEVAAIRSGARDRVDEDQPTELRPLAIELNQLAADNAAALATARMSAANLAHALKTPVTALALALRDDPGHAAQVARIDATIRHHLARARVEAINRRASTPLRPAVVDLVAAVRGIHGARDLSIETGISPDLAVAVDPRDLDEIVGNLLDNAARHATCRVRITAAPSAAERRIRIEIADDGPGIPISARRRVAQPGTRLDERDDGHGFGLAIVSDLAALYGGSLVLDDAAEGGLLAAVMLPASPSRQGA